jgi:hypothetical protein
MIELRDFTERCTKARLIRRELIRRNRDILRLAALRPNVPCERRAISGFSEDGQFMVRRDCLCHGGRGGG